MTGMTLMEVAQGILKDLQADDDLLDGVTISDIIEVGLYKYKALLSNGEHITIDMKVKKGGIH